jgi:cytochrome c peroxidase
LTFRRRNLFALIIPIAFTFSSAATGSDTELDRRLLRRLQQAGFTGRIEQSLPQRLGRPVDPKLADLGRLLFFDNVLGLHGDNSCAGCHSPAFSFGDSQSIAIGVDSNRIVGPHRKGPRNQRKAPPVTNSAFFPKLMLNSRFLSLSGDPFDNSRGFKFPLPEGTHRFPANDRRFKHLLAAQGHIPPTELVEMAGFSGTRGSISSEFDQFDNHKGISCPLPDNSGFRNEPIRKAVLERINAVAEYRKLFGSIFNQGKTFQNGEILFSMVGQALGEFQISVTFANAPIDRYARGDLNAMTESQKRGALLFFDRNGCVQCHAVAGQSNEMFSDFKNRVIGVPQIAPEFGVRKGNVIFDGRNRDEDFGVEQISLKAEDRYKFRTSPLRNVSLQPAFFHNGAFTRLEDAIRHHLDPRLSARNYDPIAAGVDSDLTARQGPISPVLERLDPILNQPVHLTAQEFKDLVEFVKTGLLDPRALPQNLCKMLPKSVPSRQPVLIFEGCP